MTRSNGKSTTLVERANRVQIKAVVDRPLVSGAAVLTHQVLLAAVERGDTGYAARGELPEAFAEFAAARHDWTVAPERVFLDPRGFFVETYRENAWAEVGLPRFVQDNHSRSGRGVLRGHRAFSCEDIPHGQSLLQR